MSRRFRYMLLQLAAPLLVSVAALTGVMWTFQSIEFMDMVLNDGADVSALFWLAMTNVPKFMAVLLPLALFAVVAFIHARMTNDSEIAIWSAAGLSPLQIAAPALALAAVVTGIAYAVNLYLMPASYAASQDLRVRLRAASNLVGLRPGQFNPVGESLTIYAEQRTREGVLTNILVDDRREEGRHVTVLAARGQVLEREQGQDDAPRLVLSDGNRQVLDARTGELRILYFDSYALPLTPAGKDADPYRWREPRERYLHELFTLAETGRDAENDRRFEAELRAEGHYRLASPLLTFAFALAALVAVLRGQHSRTGQWRRIAGATAAVLLLQVASLTLASTIAKNAALVPAMYALPLVSAALALRLLAGRRRRAPATRRAEAAAQ